MASRRFVSRFGGQLALLVAAGAALGWLLPQTGLFATKLLVGVAAGAAAWSLWLQLQRTNKELARFVTAIVHRDFAQAFREERQGSGFDELGGALNHAIGSLREDRARREAELRFAAALADGAPMPLLAIGPDGTVELANKSARRLFAAAEGGGIAGLARYGESLVAALNSARPGTRQLARIIVDGLPQRATVTTAEVERLGRPWRIVSIEIIQRELDAAEIAVQADLVRVLTHEIMNSMTPVTSLAETVAATAATLDPADQAALDDVRIATAALARRAAGIMHFVESYRTFTRAPTLARTRFALEPWSAELARLFLATPAAARVALEINEIPAGLMLDADANLLAQVILNLLKNAAEAAADHAMAPIVRLTIEPVGAKRIGITVTDNGPGIPVEQRDEVFLPFYTTKPAGTGIGLSFARHIAQLHDGMISIDDAADGGAAITLLI